MSFVRNQVPLETCSSPSSAILPVTSSVTSMQLGTEQPSPCSLPFPPSTFVLVRRGFSEGRGTFLPLTPVLVLELRSTSASQRLTQALWLPPRAPRVTRVASRGPGSGSWLGLLTACSTDAAPGTHQRRGQTLPGECPPLSQPSPTCVGPCFHCDGPGGTLELVRPQI